LDEHAPCSSVRNTTTKEIKVNEKILEAAIQAKGSTAPRLTPDYIDSCIFGAQFWVPDGTTTTICAMKLNNGFIVVGSSACASPENFDAEIGKNIAYDNAREQIWALEGYILCDSIWRSKGEL
jgi:hypothetical protein